MKIEAIADDIFKIEVDLPKTPLRITNSYLIRGPERSLLIDTGFNHPVSRAALLAGLAELRVDMDRTDIFVTHLHSDHAGLIHLIATPSTRIFMSEADGKIVAGGRESDFWERFREFYRFTGLYAGGHVRGVEDHPGYAYAPPASDRIEFVPSGHVVAAGRRSLRTVLAKGHTRGHLCLYEPEERILFSGDHVLGKITPNITQMSFDHDALGEYLDSLELVAGLGAKIAYPGHRVPIADLPGRVCELRRHHERRLEEVMDIVGDGGPDTVEVTRRMRWSLTIENWDDYPPAQKLFSAGEALAHLHYLTLRGRLRMSWDDGVVHFEKA